MEETEPKRFERWTGDQIGTLVELVKSKDEMSWKQITDIHNERHGTKRNFHAIETKYREVREQEAKMRKLEELVPVGNSENTDVNTYELNKLRDVQLKGMIIRKMMFSEELYSKMCMEFSYTVVPNEEGEINFSQVLETAVSNFMEYLKGEKGFVKENRYQRENTPGADVVGTDYLVQCKFHSDGVQGEAIRTFNGTADQSKELFFFANSYKKIRKGYEKSISHIQLFKIVNDVTHGLVWRFKPVNIQELLVV